MVPGMTTRPPNSITGIPAGAVPPASTRVNLPASTTIVAFSMAPSLMVKTWAPVMAKDASFGLIPFLRGPNGPTSRGWPLCRISPRSYSNWPSTNTRSTRSAVKSKKCPSSRTRSASFPTSMLPTRSSSIIALAPLIVMTSSACWSVRPCRARNAPYSRKSLKCWLDMSVWMLAVIPASRNSSSRFMGSGSL